MAGRAASVAKRQAQTIEVDGYRIRPDALPGTGWVVENMASPGSQPWYLASREQAIASIPRHRARYAGRACVSPQAAGGRLWRFPP